MRSFRAILVLALFALLAGPAARACALATESFGNDPIKGFGFDPKVLDAANLPSRVYWYEVNGNPYFFFRGNTTALNEALEKFAAIPTKDREIILLPGRGKGHNLGGEREFAYDWDLHVPEGLHFAKGGDVGDTRATFTIHIHLVRPRVAPDVKQVRRWIADLDSNDFAVRDAATRELEKLANAAAPTLREALQDKPAPETRRRLEALLDKLDGIDLDLLRVPAGIPVVDLGDLLARARKAMLSDDRDVRGQAILRLANSLADTEEVLPDLLKALKTEKDEYVRRCLASALVRLGAGARPALPLMKEQLQDPDENIRNAFTQAIELIGKDGDEKPDEKMLLERRAIREQIQARCKKLRAESRD